MENDKKEVEELKLNLKNEIQQRDVEIEELKKELETTATDKYQEIESLKDERDSQLKEIEALNLKIESLEETIAGAKGAPQLLEEIKNIMGHKGFLSDKEFDDLLEQLNIT